MEKFEFLEYLRDEGISYNDKGDVIEVGEEDGDIDFSLQPFRFTKFFPDGVKIKFVNRGELSLSNIEVLTDGMEFSNEGGVSIYSQAGVYFGEGIKIICDGELYLSNCDQISDDIIISPSGGMALEDVVELYKGIDLSENIQGDITIKVKDSNKLVIPQGTEFNNNGKVEIKGDVLLEDVFFNNTGEVDLAQIHNIGNNVTFSNKSYVESTCNKMTGDGIRFINEGDVILDRVQNIKHKVEFSNTGGVSLDQLLEIPKDQRFDNEGGVYLRSIKEIPYNIYFSNKGSVITSIDFGVIDRNIGEKRILNLLNKRLS
jgi:hypothetical protein